MNNLGKFYFLTFCSLGPPHDSGQDLSKNISNIKTLLGHYFDDIIFYTPSKLKECDGSDDFCNVLDGVFPLNPGINSNGCGDFKSFIIDKTLSEIDENDVLFYHDCNFEKYTQYWQTDWENIRESVDFLLTQNKSDFFIPFESEAFGQIPQVRLHGKRYTTEAILEDPVESDIVSRCWEIASNRMIIKNTQASRDFFADYKNLCGRKDLLMKYPNPDPYPQFTHSCPEQHVLNCLIYKYILDGKLDPEFPRFSFPNRKFILNSGVEVRVNSELSKYMQTKSIKEFERRKTTNGIKDQDIRGTKEFGQDLFST